MPRCPICETEYPPDLTACPTCASREEARPCQRCGEAFAGSDACPTCGLARSEFPCETHPTVNAEGRCVVCGKAVCGECEREEGPATLCAEHMGLVIIQGWAQVYTTTSEFEAQLLRDNLAAEGIDAQIYSQKDNMFSVDLGELSIVRLLVPAWEYLQASKVIREHMDKEGEVAFACPSCGEAYEPGARECATCKAQLA